MRRWPSGLLRLYIAAMCVWLLAPIVIVVILAFSGDGYLRFPPTSFSLQWFDRFFGNLQWQRALLSSLIIGAIACIVSTTIGFFSAYAFLRTDFRGKKLLLSLMLTPVIVPSIITAIAMYYFAGRLGLTPMANVSTGVPFGSLSGARLTGASCRFVVRVCPSWT